MTVDLTQDEASRLASLEKRRADDRSWPFPALGGSIGIPLESIDGDEQFMLDLSRGYIKLSKVTYQERYVITPLLRLDVDGPDHFNPDGERVPCPHFHIYREGYGTRWAIPVTDEFSDVGNLRTTLSEFLIRCNVVEPPSIDLGLF